MINCILIDVSDFSSLEEKFHCNAPSIAEQIDIRKELLNTALSIAFSELKDPNRSGPGEFYATSQEIITTMLEKNEWGDPYGLITDSCMFELVDAAFALSIEQIYNYAYHTCRNHFSSVCRRYNLEGMS